MPKRAPLVATTYIYHDGVEVAPGAVLPADWPADLLDRLKADRAAKPAPVKATAKGAEG